MDNEENPSRFGPKYFPDPGMFGEFFNFNFAKEESLPWSNM